MPSDAFSRLTTSHSDVPCQVIYKRISLEVSNGTRRHIYLRPKGVTLEMYHRRLRTLDDDHEEIKTFREHVEWVDRSLDEMEEKETQASSSTAEKSTSKVKRNDTQTEHLHARDSSTNTSTENLDQPKAPVRLRKQP